jgi:hypothetical protein
MGDRPALKKENESVALASAYVVCPGVDRVLESREDLESQCQQVCLSFLLDALCLALFADDALLCLCLVYAHHRQRRAR